MNSWDQNKGKTGKKGDGKSFGKSKGKGKKGKWKGKGYVYDLSSDDLSLTQVDASQKGAQDDAQQGQDEAQPSQEYTDGCEDVSQDQSWDDGTGYGGYDEWHDDGWDGLWSLSLNALDLRCNAVTSTKHNRQEGAKFQEAHCYSAGIMAVARTRILRIGVDSGACASVMPINQCTDYPFESAAKSRAGLSYLPAGGPPLVEYGMRRLRVLVGDDGERRLKMRVLKVRKALLAVADMVDVGHDVVFRSEARGGSHAIHHASGIRTPFVRRNQVYEIEAAVLPYESRQQRASPAKALASVRENAKGNGKRDTPSATVIRGQTRGN